MKPTEELIQEHNAIKLMLAVMNKIVENLRHNKAVELKDIEDIVNFLKTFADKCHHGKEETVLFPELVAVGIPSENGPVGVMLYEHTQGRAYIQAIQDGAHNWEKDHDTSAEAIAGAMSSYIALMQNHILKEENILFVMANQRLAQQTQKEISEKFEQIEENVVGHGVHEQFHELLTKLKAKYIN